jgi:uncharacterized phage protein (TIGR01671 family)
MREILFRAKTVGEWAVGYYDGYGLSPSISINPDDVFRNVDSETLCEFTGRYDKDGVRIFEGDIVRLSLPLAKDLVYTTIGKIVYHESCAFICEVPSKGGEFPLSPNFEYEVIGNIYDNPELLEGESK